MVQQGQSPSTGRLQTAQVISRGVRIWWRMRVGQVAGADLFGVVDPRADFGKASTILQPKVRQLQH
jgi:hypothetical protein